MNHSKYLLVTLALLLSTFGHSQNVIEWDSTYSLDLSDFRASTTQIGEGTLYSLHSSSRMDFSFFMNTYEFAFTKNFNPKVSCTFTRSTASLIAPNEEIAQALLNFARYELDLTELYARKFRKQLYENKGAFSSVSFFEPIYDRLQKELVERHASAARETDIGRNTEKLLHLHEEVLKEMEELPDFCKTCTPAKKKRKK